MGIPIPSPTTSEDRSQMDEVREIDMEKYGYCYEPKGKFRTGEQVNPNPNGQSEEY